MAKSPEDIAVASEDHEGRQSEARGGTKFSAPSASPKVGKTVPKGNAAAGDPTASGTKTNRSGVMAERNGAAHTIITNIVKQNDPAAGATLANAKILPSAIHRGGNFEAGLDSAY